MNDCIWLLMGICEDPHDCRSCKNYLSMNSKESEALIDEWDEAVEAFLIPLREKIAEKFGFEGDIS